MRTVAELVAGMDRLSQVSTKTAAERSTLLAAARWANSDGMIWVSVEKWAGLAGVNVRTLQRVLRRLIDRGLVKVIDESNGRSHRRTTTYRIPALDRYCGDMPEHSHPAGSTLTPKPGPLTPGIPSEQPRHGATRTTKEQNPERKVEQKRAAGWNGDAMKAAAREEHRT